MVCQLHVRVILPDWNQPEAALFIGRYTGIRMHVWCSDQGHSLRAVVTVVCHMWRVHLNMLPTGECGSCHSFTVKLWEGCRALYQSALLAALSKLTVSGLYAMAILCAI
jgi:hypothetical protein